MDANPKTDADRRNEALLPCLARWLLATVLAATGIGKLLDVPGFAAVVARYDALPAALVVTCAWGLTLAELGLSAWLASAVRRRWAGVAAVLLHLGYLAWAAVALTRGLIIPNCGCFGVFLARPLGPRTLIEDAILIAFSAFVARSASARHPT